MKQRAREAGVLANPYKFVEPGETFEHPEAMVWADPVNDDPPEPKPKEAALLKGSKAKADPPDVI